MVLNLEGDTALAAVAVLSLGIVGVLAAGAAGIVPLGGLLDVLSGFTDGLPAVPTDAVVFTAAALLFGLSIWRASEADDESAVWPLVALAGLVGMGWVVLSDPAGAIATARTYWWVAPLLLVAYVGAVFVSERAGSASGSGAVTSTQRRVESTAEEASQAGIGLAVGIVGTGAAIAMTLMSGVEQFGDILAGFAGEAAYFATIALGYLGLGGSLPGDWIIPSLSPLQYVAIALIIGGLAIAFRD